MQHTDEMDEARALLEEMLNTDPSKEEQSKPRNAGLVIHGSVQIEQLIQNFH